jgi:predicted phosphodiesterase
VKYAILSDVHSNVESLQTALGMIEADETLVSLGDVVGYGPNPNECVELLRQRATHAVLGNHDLAALENFGVERFNSVARTAIEWTQQRLDPQSRLWLDALPYELRFPDFLLVHGAPVHYFEYILDKETAAAAFKRTDAPLIFIGHTHIAEYWDCDENGAIGHKHMQSGGELTLEPGKRYIIDVGSVGQPRDLNPDASFVRYDSENRRVQWVRYPYPILEVTQKMRDAGLPEFLAERLTVGR